jgi:hypothetical protein
MTIAAIAAPRASSKLRGRGRSTSMMRFTRPGRVAIRTMRSPRRTASRTLCVTKITVFEVSSQTRSISS